MATYHDPKPTNLLQNLHRTFQRTQTHLNITDKDKLDPKLFSSFLQKITKKLQTIKNLKGLTLDLGNAQLGSRNMKDLSRGLFNKLYNLENLKIILTDYTNPWFLKVLRGSRNLRSFEIRISGGKREDILKPQLEDLIKTLKESAPRLQNAKFAFDPLRWPIYYVFPSLQDWGLERLRNLRNLTLFLPISAFLEKKNDLKHKLALSVFKRMGRLKSLDMTLVESYYQEPEFISDELALDPKKLFPNLKSFKCGAVCKRLTYWKGLELFASKIASGLADLEEFELRFKQDSDLKDQDIQTTFQCLASLNSDLTHFNRTFSGGKLTSNGANVLLATLSGPRLRNLQMLSLKFWYSQGINNGFLAKLSETVGCHLNQVRCLHLFFHCRPSESSAFVESLLAFVGYEGISDRGISNLGKNLLRGCGNLELLSLELWENSLVSDQGVKSLCDSLSKIESLKRVQLKLKLCPQVSEKGEHYVREKLGDKNEVKLARE